MANCVTQMNIGYNSLSKIEVVSLLNVFSISAHSLRYDDADRPSRYYPKVYLGTMISYGTTWNMELKGHKQFIIPSTWPERKIKMRLL